jgi:drug/metabolite transporter (DMT)-like permease
LTTLGGSARATAVGGVAILLWSALAVLTTASGAIPPFELMTLSFAAAFAAAAIRAAWLGRVAIRRLRQPGGAWALGFCALFLYHALYFFALRATSPSEASLIAYLWPLLIVLFSAATPGQTLRPAHLAGALLGLAGTALLVLARPAAGAGLAPWLGDAAALGCAFVWSGYSVLNRRYAFVPSDVIAATCGPVALAGLACHLAWEPWVGPTGAQWAAIVALGLGPVGLAFIAWDHATKHGSLPLLGAASYLAPLFSTILLVAFGHAPASLALFAAAALILAGAAVAGLATSVTSDLRRA